MLVVIVVGCVANVAYIYNVDLVTKSEKMAYNETWRTAVAI